MSSQSWRGVEWPGPDRGAENLGHQGLSFLLCATGRDEEVGGASLSPGYLLPPPLIQTPLSWVTPDW